MNQPDSIAARPAGFAERHPRIAGALLLLAMHVGLLPFVGTVVGLKAAAGYLLVGVTQIVYVVPAAIVLLKRGQPEVMKGMLFAALATFVVNAAGCALVLHQLSKI